MHFCDVGFDVGQRVRRDETRCVQTVVVQVAAPGDGHDRHPRSLGRVGHPGRRLAVQGLLVEPALAGDDQPGAVQLVLETDQLQHHVDARARRRLQHAEGGEPDAAGRSGAGDVGRAGVDRRRPAGPAPRPAARRRPGSRPSAGRRRGRRRAGRAAGCRRRWPGRTRRRAGASPARTGRPRRAAPATPPPSGSSSPSWSRKRAPERLQQAGAAVGARAAADAEDDPGAALVQGRRDELTGAETAGRQRFQLVGRQQHQAGREGQLDHGHLVAHGDRRLDRLADRAGHLDRAPPETGPDRGVEGAVAAVGDRQHPHVQVGVDGQQPGPHRGADLPGRQRPLELVGGDDNVADRSRPAPVRPTGLAVAAVAHGR